MYRGLFERDIGGQETVGDKFGDWGGEDGDFHEFDWEGGLGGSAAVSDFNTCA
jgi:hypothetical protein